MDMNKGIDAQVSDRVDAYRGQPQQLMQMYQQNKELVDLLALQKLKSEKEAAKRQIEMQMQQQPGTVAQQREQEVMQMTKDELAKQTQGVLQRKQQQQQVNIQRAAKGGIGALAQNRPAPAPAQGPTPMMASGGIVAFQPGGSVGGMPGLGQGSSVKERVEALGINYDEFQRLPAAERERILQTVRDQSMAARAGQRMTRAGAQALDNINDPLKAIGNLGIGIANSRVGRAAGLSDPRKPIEPFEYNTADTAARERVAANQLPVDAEGNPVSIESLLPPGPAQDLPKDVATPTLNAPPVRRPTADTGSGLPSVMPDAPTPARPSATEEATVGTTTTPAPAPAAATPTPAGTGIAGLGAGSMGGAENALMRGVKIGEDVLGRDEKAAKYAEYEAQLAELDEELNDPAAERRQQLQAFLIGTAGATNIGYAMAGGAAASINLENQQKRNRRNRMLSRIQLGERGMELDSEMGRAALSLGNQMFADFNANKRAAISAAATLDAARLRKVTADADREFEREKQEDSNALQIRELDIREAEVAVEQARNEELALSRRVDGVLTATKNLLQQSEDAYKAGAERYGVEDAAANLSMLTPKDDGYDAAMAQFETVAAEADGWATQYLERFGVKDTLQDLEAQYYALTGVDNMPGLNPDDILEVQKQGE